MGDTVPITVAIISYNGARVVPGCLESILAQDVAADEILVADNASTDGTPEMAAEKWPEVRILRLPDNRGPNPARNAALREARNRWVLLVDDDAILDPGCLRALDGARRAYPAATVWSPRIVYDDRPDLIQFDGVSIHYTGEAVLVNGDTPVGEGLAEITPIQVAGGVSYLLERDRAFEVGGFDEDYFFGRTDGEFTFRLTLTGHRLYTVPAAVCRHRVKRRGLSKVFFQVRNRLFMIGTTYSVRTLVVLLPALAVYEVSVALFLALKGRFGAYLRGTWAAWRALPAVRRKRRALFAAKVVRDRDVLRGVSINIRGDLVEQRAVAVAKSLLDRFFSGYWRLVRGLL